MKYQLAAFPWNDTTQSKELRRATTTKINLRLLAPSTVEFTIAGDEPEAAFIQELVSDLIVRADGVALVRARCLLGQDECGETGYSVRYTFGDYRAVLARRNIKDADTRFFNNMDQSDIAWSLISTVQARANGNYGITRGVGSSTGIKRTIQTKQGAFVAKEIASLANADNGFDWDVSPAMAFDLYYPSRGANNGVGLEYGKTVSSFTRTRNPASFANDTTTVGSAATLPVERLSATVTTDAEGRWDATFSDPNVDTQDVLDAKATHNRDVASAITPAYSVKLSPGFWKGESHIGRGDTIRLRVRRGRVNDSLLFRVVQISIQPDEDADTEEVRLGLVDV